MGNRRSRRDPVGFVRSVAGSRGDQSWRDALLGLTAPGLSGYFRVDPRNWLNLQVAYDLWKLEQESGRQLNRDVKPLVAV